jgi:hypothetical protein
MRGNLLAGILPAYLLLVLATGVFLYLYFLLRQEMRRSELKYSGRVAKLDKTIEELRQRALAVDTRVSRLELKPEPEPASATAQPGALNLTRRSQAIQRSRRGESPGQIAAALNIPLGEVELLLKVHRMVVATL